MRLYVARRAVREGSIKGVTVEDLDNKSVPVKLITAAVEEISETPAEVANQSKV